MKNKFEIFSFLIGIMWVKNSSPSNGNSASHLFPPGSFGSTNNYNVTGPLNSFVEQLQANSRSEEAVSLESIGFDRGAGLSINPSSQQSQIPIVQMPTGAQGQGNVIYYGSSIPNNNNNNNNNNIELQIPSAPSIQSVPGAVVLGPQNRPVLDPALQQLLNSFNTNPNSFDFNQLSQQQQQYHQQIQTNQQYGMDNNRPIVSVSYITCYVGCSHVTNIVSPPNDATPNVNRPNFFASIFFSIALILAYIL